MLRATAIASHPAAPQVGIATPARGQNDALADPEVVAIIHEK